MTDADTTFEPSRCPKCGVVTLAGLADGLRWRLAARLTPLDDARVLRRYGVQVLALERAASGAVWARVWHADDRTTPYLTSPHVCGAEHEEDS